MTKEDSEGNLIPAPIATDMYQLDSGMTMPWIRWFQQFRAQAPRVVMVAAKLFGVQTVGSDKIGTPTVVRIPTRCKISIYELEGKCYTAPTGSAFEAEITYRRAGDTAFTSMLNPGEYLTIPVGETNATPIEPLVSDFYDGDDFQVNVISAGGACADIELTMRGGLLLK